MKHLSFVLDASKQGIMMGIGLKKSHQEEVIVIVGMPWQSRVKDFVKIIVVKLN